MVTEVARPLNALSSIARIRGRVRKLLVLDGLLLLGFGLCGGVAVSFVADYFLVLPAAVRALFLIAGVGLLAYHAYLHVGTWIARPISDEDIANLLERAQPDLHQALITAVELTRSGSLAAAHVSPSLLRGVVAGVDDRIASLNLSEVAPGRRLLGRGTLTGIAVVVIVLSAAAEPTLSRLWFRRNLLLAEASWPKRTELRLLRPALPIVVATGDSFEVVVEAVRGDPPNVMLRTVEGDRAERVEMLARTTSDAFRKVFENVSRPFRFFVEGDDAVLGPYDVDVKLRPRIDMQSVRLWCLYPPHTRRPPTPREEPFRHGNLKVPVGTQVEFSMAMNVPVRSVFLVFRGMATEADSGGPPPTGDSSEMGNSATMGEAAWPDPGAVELEVQEGKFFSGEFTVEETGYYYFQSESQDEFRSLRPDRFRVEAVPDREPEVRITRPDRPTEFVSPEATLDVTVTASDDYGLDDVKLSGLFFERVDTETGDLRTFPIVDLKPVGESTDRSAAGVSLQGSTALEIFRLGVEGRPPLPGGRFQFMAIARDTGGNTGESELRFLEVVDEADLLRKLGDLLMIVRDQLRDVKQRQMSVRKDLSEVEGRWAPSNAVSAEDAQKLFRHQQDQLAVSQALERQGEELDRILRLSISNKVGDEKWRSWVQGVGSDLRQLALGKSRQTEGLLESIRKEATAASQDLSRLRLALVTQGEVEREIENLILRLTEFGDMNAVIQMLREIRTRQAEIREATRTQIEEALPEDSGR